MNEKQAFQIFTKSIKPPHKPQLNDCKTEIILALGVKKMSDSQENQLFNCWRSYLTKKAKCKQGGGNSALIAAASITKIVIEIDDKSDNDEKKSEPTPCKKKKLDELQRKQLIRRTDEIFNIVSEYANDEDLEIHRVLGLLLTRCEKKLHRDIGNKLWLNDFDEKICPIENTLALYTDCGLGRATYRNQRKLLAVSGFPIFPSWDKLRNEQKHVTPEVKNLPEPHIGVYYELLPAVRLTADRILQDLCLESLSSTSLNMQMKFGFDGSGNHSIFNQLTSTDTHNMVLAAFCPLKMKSSDNELVWTEPSPNCAQSQRPLSLQLGKETVENLQSFTIFDEDMHKLKNTGFLLTKDGKTFSVKVDIVSFMMDLKAAHLYMGIGGADCDLCTLSQKQYMDPNVISGDILINRNIESLHAVFDELVQDDGKILKKKGDYEHRAGQTFKPITTYDAKTIQILHALLRTFDHFMKVCVHVKARVFDWSESPSSRRSLFLKNAKSELQVILL